MPVYHDIAIKRIGSDYQFEFGRTPARMHRKGHLLIHQDRANIVIKLKVITPGFTFQNDGTGDGTQALFISNDPARTPKDCFRDYGVFTAPTLNPPAFTVLTFGSRNDDGEVYFYQLNLWDADLKKLAICDPIIVNR